MTYNWEFNNGPGTLTFSDKRAAAPSFKASVDGQYVITVTVTNEVGGKTTRAMTVFYDNHASRPQSHSSDQHQRREGRHQGRV